MRDDFRLIATAVSKMDQAKQALDEFDVALGEGRQAIADAGQAGAPFAIGDGWRQGSSISIRMFGEGPPTTRGEDGGATIAPSSSPW